MVVLCNAPARPDPVPSGPKISLLPSPGPGGAKLGWFMMLNISIRNCTLKSSEILLIRLFLNTEKSRFVMPGPIKRLRPTFPRRLKHVGNVTKTGGVGGFDGAGWALGGLGL